MNRMSHGQATVGTDAVLLVPGRVTRTGVLIRNAEADTNVLYLGADDTVTADDGMPVDAIERVLLGTGAPVYAVASDDTDVRFVEFF